MNVAKIIGIAVIVIAVIGLRVYNRVPRYRSIVDEKFTITSEQSYQYEFEIKKSNVKVKIDCVSNDNEMTILLLNPSDYEALNSGEGPGPGFSPIKENMQTKTFNQEVTLNTGSYFVWIEGFTDDNDVGRSINGNLEISVYQ